MQLSGLRLNVMNVLKSLLIDLAIDAKGSKYILRRFANEGMYFLTTTLPKLGKAVVKGLEEGYLDRSSLTGFAWKGATLDHLGGVINLIFDKGTGFLLPNPSAVAIKAARTLAEFFYKLAIPYDDETIEKAQASFIKNEEELGCIDTETQKWADVLRKDFETHYNTLSSASAQDVLSTFRPRATSGTFVGSGPDYFLERVSTARRVYPRGNKGYQGFYKPYPSARVTSHINGLVEKLKPHVDGDYSELLFVPKDSRGPRTICREFRVRVETQMAYFDWMTSQLPIISKGAINFQDQGVNRALAATGSVSRKWSTLDLKDASDRVSYSIVKTVFKHSPACRWFTRGANRARNVVLPNGEVRKLNKLAGMGSGLTFPTMALLISLTICRVVVNRTGHKYDYVRKNVFVYGDDIVLPTQWVEHARRGLANVGLVVNGDKSFCKGHFRESCGGDYYNGADVTPIRMKLASSEPNYSSVSRQLTFGKNSAAINQIYEMAKTAWNSGYVSLTNCFLGAMPKGVLFPGRLQDDGSFTDFRKGTSHLDPYATYTVFYAASETRRWRKVFGLFVRDPFYYLSGKLRQSANKDGSLDNGSGLYEIAPTSGFEELMVPRSTVIKSRKVQGDFLLSGDISSYNEARLNKLRCEVFSKNPIVASFAAF